MRRCRSLPAWALAPALALACSSGPSDPGGNPNADPDPDPTPTPTLQSVTCTLDAIDDVEYEGNLPPAVWFSWTGEGHLSDGSTVPLDSTIVRLGGTRLLGYMGRTSGEGTLGSDDTTDGTNDLSITCYRGSKSATARRTFGIYRLVTISFEAIHFFSREPNATGLTVTVSDGSPSPRAVTLDGGTGSLKVRAGTADVQIQDTDSGQLHYLERVGAPPGEHLVFDEQVIAQPLEVVEAADYQVVSIASQQFLDELGQQWGHKAIVPLPGELRLVLYASGNPTCPDEWTPERDDPAINTCGDIETWPPGKPFTPEQIEEFHEFVAETRANLENPIIPWSPYEIEEVLADSLSIQNYISEVELPLALAEVSAVGTYVVIGTGGAPFRETSQWKWHGATFDDLVSLFAASATANGNRAFQFSNEMQLFGSRHESLEYQVCSVRDDESKPLPCPFGETAPAYYEYDRKAHAVVATYFARAQVQPVTFNVRLPDPFL